MQKEKNECRDYKENYSWKEDYITISQEQIREDSQGRKRKTTKNKLLTNISINSITELNELFYAGVKLICDEIRVPLKRMNRN